MTWAKFDDLYDDNPKIKRAWRLSGYAVGLHSSAITASCRHESDGLVDPEWLADKLAHLPRAAGAKAVETLVRLRLFEQLPAGEVMTLDDGCGFTVTIGPLVEDAHVVHDFLDYNDSSANLADRRRRDAERKAARRRGESRKIPDGVRADSAGSPVAPQAESEHPDPTRPDPAHEPPQPPASGGSLARRRSSLRKGSLFRPSCLPPEPPAGRRRSDWAEHHERMAAWQAWAASPDGAASDAELAIAATALKQVEASVTEGTWAMYLSSLHVHRGADDGVLLLGADSAVVSYVGTRFERVIEAALPPGTRWRLLNCGCLNTRLEAVA